MVYREANAKLLAPALDENRVVFLGDSIAAGWATSFSTLFSGKPYIGRGISSETTQPMLIWFRPDVIDLHPKVLVILAGTNDIVANTGRSTKKMIEDNPISMVDLAQLNGIRVVLVSVFPAYNYWWQRGMEPAEKIVALNDWIRDFAVGRGVVTWIAMGLADERNAINRICGYGSARGARPPSRFARAGITRALKTKP